MAMTPWALVVNVLLPPPLVLVALMMLPLPTYVRHSIAGERPGGQHG
jgi:hypothetical protein